MRRIGGPNHLDVSEAVKTCGSIIKRPALNAQQKRQLPAVTTLQPLLAYRPAPLTAFWGLAVFGILLSLLVDPLHGFAYSLAQAWLFEQEEIT